MAREEVRDEYDDQLGQRTEENYARREGERTFQGIFKKGLELKQWTADDSKNGHKFRIIPYRAGQYDPRVELDSITYGLDVSAHRNVGPRDAMFVCLEMTFQEPCPICEELLRRRKNSPEGELEKKKYDDILKQLKPTRRIVYNVVVLTNDEEEEKGVRIWHTSHYNMEAQLLKLSKIPRMDGGGYILFAHPKRGKAIFFIRTGKEERTKFEGVRFVDDDQVMPEWLEDAQALDELIHIPTYDEVREVFYDTGGGGVKVDEDEKPKPRSRRAPPELEPEDGQEEVIPRRGQRSSAPVEEDDPPPRRRRQPAENEDTESPPRSRRAAALEDVGDAEPAPRSRRAPPPQEDEDPPPRRRSAPPAEEPAPGRKSKMAKLPELEDNSEGPECPVPRGVYGRDADQFKECEGCPHWKPCIRATSKFNRSKSDETESY